MLPRLVGVWVRKKEANRQKKEGAEGYQDSGVDWWEKLKWGRGNGGERVVGTLWGEYRCRVSGWCEATGNPRLVHEGKLGREATMNEQPLRAR